jgi:hypothetical protein
MNQAREHVIRERAYRIWESQGRPDGKHDEHWRQAANEVHGLEDLPDADDGKLVAPASSGERPQRIRTGDKT